MKPKHPSIAEQHAQWCIHYQRNPALRDREACAKGVVYDELARVGELGLRGSSLRLPCIRSHHDPAERNGQPLFECPHLQWPSKAECEARERDHEAMMKRIVASLEVLEPIRKANQGRSASGSVPCPVCGAELQWAKAGCNDHMRARCATPGCINWIE